MKAEDAKEAIVEYCKCASDGCINAYTYGTSCKNIEDCRVQQIADLIERQDAALAELSKENDQLRAALEEQLAIEREVMQRPDTRHDWRELAHRVLNIARKALSGEE